jgi:hypothetical protein
MADKDEDHEDRLIWGAHNICKTLNLENERQVYHLASRGVIPVHKAGATLVGKLSDLRDPARWPTKKTEPQ